MRAQGKMTTGSFIWILILNGIMITGFFFACREVLHGIDNWLTPLAGTEGLADDAKLALTNLNGLLAPVKTYLAPAIFGAGALVSLILWLIVQGLGRGLITSSERAAVKVPTSATKSKPANQETAPAQPAPQPERPSHTAAVQILSILQRQGRLIDFLQEDLSSFEDAQIGAAVRNIHQESKAALAEYVKLEPVFAQEEGTEVSVPKGFDAKSIRLTGEVSGEPPFSGVLRHRGWRVARIELPQITAHTDEEQILAPAEVEVGS